MICEQCHQYDTLTAEDDKIVHKQYRLRTTKPNKHWVFTQRKSATNKQKNYQHDEKCA
jgi:hypothetical protein